MMQEGYGLEPNKSFMIIIFDSEIKKRLSLNAKS